MCCHDLFSVSFKEKPQDQEIRQMVDTAGKDAPERAEEGLEPVCARAARNQCQATQVAEHHAKPFAVHEVHLILYNRIGQGSA